MKKIIITIATGSIAAIVGALVSDELLKVDMVSKLIELFKYFIDGNIIIPKWFALITIIAVLLFILFRIHRINSLINVFKSNLSSNKIRRINTDELIRTKLISEDTKLYLLTIGDGH